MGSLIQTKGTQRLAKLFNDRFDAGSIGTTGGLVKAAFNDVSQDLLSISDSFIAANAVAGWPTTGTTAGDDLLYPAATMRPTNTGVATTSLNFTLPPVLAAAGLIPTSIQAGAAVCSLDKRSTIKRGTVAGTPTAVGAGGTFSVPLLDRSGAAVSVTISAGPPVERICFTQGRHEQLVRRWRWYLKYDLQPENHVAIRRAISNALNDSNFKKITFQAIEDTQRVLVNVETQLDSNFEFDDRFFMHIILMTHQTTSPDPIDQQS